MLRNVLALLFFLLSASAYAGLNVHHAPPAPIVLITPSNSWNGIECSGYPGSPSSSCAPTAATVQIPSNTGADVGNGTVDITVPSTAGFPANCSTAGNCTCYDFAIFGTDEANGQHACQVLNSTTIQLTYVTFVNSWNCGGTCTPPSGTNTYVGLVNGAMPVSNVTNNGSGGCRITVASTAHLATNDRYTLSEAGGVTPCNGNWAINKISSTQFDLGTTTQPGPTFSGSYTGGGSIGFDEMAIGNFDEGGNTVITANNSEFITVGAAIGNRQWINNVGCFYEDSGELFSSTQTVNPKTFTGGWIFEPSGPGSKQNGDTILTCDINPVNGITRRIALKLWLNSQPTGNGFVSRDPGNSSFSIYVDAASGKDPTGLVQATTVSTDPSGKSLTFSAAPCSPLPCTIASATVIGISNGGYITAWSQVDTTVNNLNGQSQASGCTFASTDTSPNCILVSSVGASIGPVNWTEQRACGNTVVGNSPGVNVGTITTPYQTLDVATNCVHNGGTVHVNNAATEPGYVNPRSALCVGGVCNTGGTQPRMVQVIPENGPFAISSIQWSNGVATYATATNNFATGQGVQITGNLPPEFNTYCIVTVIDTTHFSCTLPRVTGCNPSGGNTCNPFNKHPTMRIVYGQAVIPYKLQTQVYGQWNPNAQTIEYDSGMLDLATINSVQACCASIGAMPYKQDVVFRNCGQWNTVSNTGAPFGYYASGGAYGEGQQVPFYNAAGNIYSFEECAIQVAGSISGPRLYRNICCNATTTGLSVANLNSDENIAYFNVDASMPMNVIATSPVNSQGFYLGQAQRLTIEPKDNTTQSQLPTVTAVTANGTNTNITFSTIGTKGFTNAVQLMFMTGNCASPTVPVPMILQGQIQATPLSGYQYNVVSFSCPNGCSGSVTATIFGNWISACGFFAGSGVHVGDEVYFFQDEHPDYIQTTLGATGNPTADLNLYLQRYMQVGEDFILSQAGVMPQPYIQLTATAPSGSSTVSVANTAGVANNAYVSQLTAATNSRPSGCFQVGTQVSSFVANTSITFNKTTICQMNTNASINVGALTCTGQSCTDAAVAAGLLECSGGTAPCMKLQPGDFACVNSPGAPQDMECRKVIGTSKFASAGTFTIEFGFQPDISTPVAYAQSKTSLDVACIACRAGGTSFGGPSNVHQIQHASEHWVFVQNTQNELSWHFRNSSADGFASAISISQGPGMGLLNFDLFDNLFNFFPSGTFTNVPSYATITSDSPFWIGTTSTGTNRLDYYEFDTNDLAKKTGAATGSNVLFPGTNSTNIGPALSDINFSPPGTFTQPITGMIGGVFSNGTPLFPFDCDGTGIFAGAVEGACQ